MKRSHRGDAATTTMVLIAIITGVALMAMAWTAARLKCEQQWLRSGMQSEFGLFQGCLVRLPDGRWLPADLVREIDIKAPTTLRA